jgi:hypothetical protein
MFRRIKQVSAHVPGAAHSTSFQNTNPFGVAVTTLIFEVFVCCGRDDDRRANKKFMGERTGFGPRKRTTARKKKHGAQSESSRNCNEKLNNCIPKMDVQIVVRKSSIVIVFFIHGEHNSCLETKLDFGTCFASNQNTFALLTIKKTWSVKPNEAETVMKMNNLYCIPKVDVPNHCEKSCNRVGHAFALLIHGEHNRCLEIKVVLRDEQPKSICAFEHA